MSVLIRNLVIDENDEGWGPSNAPLEKFKDIPYYAPFNKGDKIGKAADWQATNQGKGRYQKGGDNQQGVSTIFSWYYQDDDNTFQLVDNQKNQLKRSVGGRRFQKNFQQRQQRGHNNWQQFASQQQKSGGGKQQQQQQQTVQRKQQNLGQNRFVPKKWGTYGEGNNNSHQRKREPSIEVKSDWTLAEQIEFSVLNKATIDSEPQADDIKTYGSVDYYDKTYDRVSSKAEKALERTEKTFFNVTTSDDPVIRQLSQTTADDKVAVFGTDIILSHLMVAPRSVFPWDVIVTKIGSKIFFDKRDGSSFDFLTVNETSQEFLIDDGRDSINSAGSLSRESTFVNQSFSQQVLSKEEKPLNLGEANPFLSEGQVSASVGYKYRKWNITPEISIFGRCEVDGVTKGIKNKESFLTIRALNEYDLKSTDWRKKIDSQRGAVFATELKNNSTKLAKWAAQSALAGTDSIRIGFVSRASQKDNFNHVILATQDYTPKEFTTQISMNIKNSWGVLRKIIEAVNKQPTGKYVLMRDPEKPNLKLYQVPEETFNKKTEKDEK